MNQPASVRSEGALVTLEYGDGSAAQRYLPKVPTSVALQNDKIILDCNAYIPVEKFLLLPTKYKFLRSDGGQGSELYASGHTLVLYYANGIRVFDVSNYVKNITYLQCVGDAVHLNGEATVSLHDMEFGKVMPKGKQPEKISIVPKILALLLLFIIAAIFNKLYIAAAIAAVIFVLLFIKK